MRIGQLEIERTAGLAPMAGVGDRAFRLLCKEFGAAYTVSEMVSAKGMHFGDPKTASLLALDPQEHPAAVQLFGDEPDTLAEAARMALEYHPDAIDLNMGCPAPKIAGNGGGCALMRNPALAGRIIRAVSDAVPLPVTVKFRKGWDDASINAVEFAKMAQENGAAALCIHGRTRAQMYAPPVDSQIIAAVKQAVTIPVMGNGGVNSAASCAEMYARTGCDLVMVGQGALGAPWIFSQIREYLQRGILPPAPPLEERLRIMLRHMRLIVSFKGERIGMREARKHAGWYLKGMRGAARLRERTGRISTLSDAEALAEDALRLSQEE